jgi:hypothetical protein
MLGKELVVRDQLLEVQEDLLEQERQTTCEVKRLLELEEEKNEKLAQELVQGKETICSLKSLSGALQYSYDILQKTHKDLEVQFDVLWKSTSKPSSKPKTTKASTSNGFERCYHIVDIDALCAKIQCSNVEQVCVESSDEAIDQENDHLKEEVKRLEYEVSKLKKQAKVQPLQDNCRNMANKLEKGKIAPEVAPQQPHKPPHHKKKELVTMDENVKYTRSAYLNTRRPNNKSGLGYKNSDKHNSGVNTIGKEFISSPSPTLNKRSKTSTIPTMLLMLITLMHITFIFLICLTMILMHRMSS